MEPDKKEELGNSKAIWLSTFHRGRNSPGDFSHTVIMGESDPGCGSLFSEIPAPMLECWVMLQGNVALVITYYFSTQRGSFATLVALPRNSRCFAEKQQHPPKGNTNSHSTTEPLPHCRMASGPKPCYNRCGDNNCVTE